MFIIQLNVFSLDFGFATFFKYPNGTHMPYSENVAFTGTLTYMSLFGHMNIRPSRRDDIIELGYGLLQTVVGGLIWKDKPIDEVFNLKDILLTRTDPSEMTELEVIK